MTLWWFIKNALAIYRALCRLERYDTFAVVLAPEGVVLLDKEQYRLTHREAVKVTIPPEKAAADAQQIVDEMHALFLQHEQTKRKPKNN